MLEASADELDATCEFVQELSAAAGDEFIHQDDRGHSLYVLVVGQALVFRWDEDTEQNRWQVLRGG